jgi:hypothetical protein
LPSAPTCTIYRRGCTVKLMLVVLIVIAALAALLLWAAFFYGIAKVGQLFLEFFKSGSPPPYRPQVPPQELWQQCPSCLGVGGNCKQCGGTGRVGR